MLIAAYWNLNKKPNDALVASLASTLASGSQRVVLGVSETTGLNRTVLTAALGSGWSVLTPLSERFWVVTNLPVHSIALGSVSTGCLPVEIVTARSGQPITLSIWFVHLSAPLNKLHADFHQIEQARDLKDAVSQWETAKANRNTVLIGDFNMDPYSVAMTGVEYLNAVMCRRIAARGSRTHKAVARPYLYNPMWTGFGDQSSSNQPGSFYWATDTGPFWHCLDQALVRPELIDWIQPDSPRLVTSIGSTDLLTGRARKVDKRISDHLPITLSISI